MSCHIQYPIMKGYIPSHFVNQQARHVGDLQQQQKACNRDSLMYAASKQRV